MNQLTGEVPWRLRFFTFWTAQAISLFGSSLTQFALVWWLTASTGAATVLATATLVATLPGVLLGPFIGVLVDRWNRRLIIVATDAVSALAAAALALLFWADTIQLWQVYVAMAVRSLAQAFQYPAVLASTSQMVPESHLTRVNGWTQMLRGAMTILAPPLGALLLGLVSFQGMMLIDVVTAGFAVILVLLIVIPQPARVAQAASFVQEFLSGLRYIRAWPALLSLVAVTGTINLLLSPAFALTPILVTQHFGGGVAQLAWMDAALGGGLLLGGGVLGMWGGFQRRIATVIAGIIGIGTGTLLIGLLPSSMFPFAIVCYALVGMMAQLADGAMIAIYQAMVAPDMQGRVFTVLISVASGMAPLGLVIAGPVADAVGVQAWYLASALLCFTMSILITRLPMLMQLEYGAAPLELQINEQNVIPRTFAHVLFYTCGGRVTLFVLTLFAPQCKKMTKIRSDTSLQAKVLIPKGGHK